VAIRSPIRRPRASRNLRVPSLRRARSWRIATDGRVVYTIASGGRVFYTVASDHQNCPIGGYTQNSLHPDRMPELQQTLELMGSIGYIRMEEIPGVFQLPQSPKAVVYAPLGETPVDPSVVLAAGKPGRVMMMAEAATRAGANVQPAAARAGPPPWRWTTYSSSSPISM
jgi:hypothetical protein